MKRWFVSVFVLLMASGYAHAQNAADSGLFTLQQAVAGESVYRRECAICHGNNLGGGEAGTALIGSTFLEKWTGQSLANLYAVTSLTMPLVNPNGLGEQQYHQVLAYILLANGYQAGDQELTGGLAGLLPIQLQMPSGDARALLAQLDSQVYQPTGVNQDWPYPRGDAGSQNYSPLDMVNADNVNQLDIAWRWKSDNFGPSPEFNFQATPVMVNGVLYTTAGNRRTAVAIDATTGETLWMHRLDEGKRGEVAPRGGSGRGVAYAEVEGHGRIYYITPGFNLVGLDAATGQPLPEFGNYGVVDMKLQLDQNIDLVNDPVGNSSPPVVVNDVLVVGPAFPAGRAPDSVEMVKGHIAAYDLTTGERRWIFHTVPQPGEEGYDTWLEGSADYTGNVGAWAPLSADPELNMVYVPVEAATGDYYGGHRPGDNLFSQSLVALDASTGERAWHFQMIHHGIWDYDPPAPPVLLDIRVNGRDIPAVAQVSKQGFVYTFDRRNGEPVWPIEERPVPQTDVPGEWTSPTQPFPTLPAPFTRQGMDESLLNDFTPEINAEARRIAAQYTLGPLYTPPTLVTDDNFGTLLMPGPTGGANWQGAVVDPETGYLYVSASHYTFTVGLVESELSEMNYVAGGPRLAGPFGLPLTKPPYGTITAIDMNRGEHVWEVANADTPADIANHPMLRDLELPRTGHAERVGLLVTKTLLFAGEGSGLYVASGGGPMFRAHDKQTGEILWEYELPARQTGLPMSYAVNGEQYILVPVGAQGHPGELVALKLQP